MPKPCIVKPRRDTPRLAKPSQWLDLSRDSRIRTDDLLAPSQTRYQPAPYPVDFHALTRRTLTCHTMTRLA